MEQIADVIASAGLDAWGICSFDALPCLLPVRAKGRLPENTKSVIVILFGYYTGDYPERNISRYAILRDYHQVAGDLLGNIAENLSRLYPQDKFIPFVDSSPIPEVAAAHLAGLGDIGDNGLLLHPVYGSYCFIGEIVTTLDLPPTGVSPKPVCLHCGRCVRACPTGALSKTGFDKTICRSYITQKKGELSPWEQEQIKAGGFAWGCDCCTDACPVNETAKQSPIEGFYQDIKPLAGQDNADGDLEDRAYGWRADALRRNLSILSGGQIHRQNKE